MAARSVAELLPRAFDELELHDVRDIVRQVGEERESLYFERKQSITSASLAKACAAFANTNGGLLLVGIDDDTDELVGIEPPSGEAQLWVKDVLRGHLLPLPPFRARFLPLVDVTEHGVLLVLVEESSTTPHLLTRSGAIYVRNPGSSDPVPIADQARLLDLTRRGREVREVAGKRAIEAIAHKWNPHDLYTLVLSPTGSSTDVVRDLYRSRRVELLQAATEIHDLSAERAEIRRDRIDWSMRRVRLQREVRRHFTHTPERFLDGVVLTSDCVVQLQRCLVAQEYGGHPEPRGPEPLSVEDRTGILAWFSEALRRGRDLILSLGGHGDLFVAFGIRTNGRHVFYASSRAEQAKDDLRFTYWSSLNGERDGELIEQVRQDVRRSLGVDPEAE